MENRRIRVGTRGSALARWQANFVTALLKRAKPELEIELRIIKTSGDRDQTRPLAELGGLGAFTNEIENALRAGEIDIAVHSLKDLPTETAEGLVLAAILEREDPRDCLVSRHGTGLMQLPAGARVGTSSARRKGEVLALRPDVQVVPLRGNVDTRLRKASSDEYDAVVIAAAGVIRLGRAGEITEYFPVEMVLPDPGQGALAVQVRQNDGELVELVTKLDHAETRAAVTAERAFLQALGGGCRMPVGAFAQVSEGRVHLRGLIASEDGSEVRRGEIEGEMTHAGQTGAQLARDLTNGETGRVHELPLSGKRILITRAREQADVLAEKIRALGGEPLILPTIEIMPVDDFAALDAALARASEFDWVILTSANGVAFVAERMRARGLNATSFGAAKIAAIGPATAHALADVGLPVDFVPTKFLGEQIAIELDVARGQRALLLRADIASETLARGLVERGVDVTNVDAYRTGRPPSRPAPLPEAVAAITFTSPSTVRNFIALADGDLTTVLDKAKIFCIGPVTAEAASELGLRVTAVAPEHTIDGLVNTIRAYYENGRN